MCLEQLLIVVSDSVIVSGTVSQYRHHSALQSAGDMRRVFGRPTNSSLVYKGSLFEHGFTIHVMSM